MSERPWHKRYHSDALSGFMGLTLEERGAYQTILDLLYDRGEPLLDNTDDRTRLLAGYLGCSVRKYRAMRDQLISKGKLQRKTDGSLTNSRFEKEVENALKKSRKLAENGMKGGRVSGENQKNSNKNKDTDKQLLDKSLSLYQKPEARSQKLDKTAAVEPPAAAPSDWVEVGHKCLDAMGVNPKDPTWTGNLGIVSQWLANGWSPELDILPTINALAVRRQASGAAAPRTLSYFTSAIGEAYQRRKSAAHVDPSAPIALPVIEPDNQLLLLNGRVANRRIAYDRMVRFHERRFRGEMDRWASVSAWGDVYPPGSKGCVYPPEFIAEAKAEAERQVQLAKTA